MTAWHAFQIATFTSWIRFPCLKLYAYFCSEDFAELNACPYWSSENFTNGSTCYYCKWIKNDEKPDTRLRCDSQYQIHLYAHSKFIRERLHSESFHSGPYVIKPLDYGKTDVNLCF